MVGLSASHHATALQHPAIAPYSGKSALRYGGSFQAGREAGAGARPNPMCLRYLACTLDKIRSGTWQAPTYRHQPHHDRSFRGRGGAFCLLSKSLGQSLNSHSSKKPRKIWKLQRFHIPTLTSPKNPPKTHETGPPPNLCLPQYGFRAGGLTASWNFHP